MPTRDFNVRPHPRALLEALDDDLAVELEKLFPVARRIRPGEEVDEAEWDVLVTAAQSVSRSAHLYVIAFGSVELGAAVQNSPVADIKPEMAMFDPVQVRRHQISLSTEMHTPDGLDVAMERLIEQDLVPVFDALERKPALMAQRLSKPFINAVPILDVVAPYLIARDSKVLAGSFARRPVRTGSVVSQCWVLPEGLTRPTEWVVEAWRQWNVIAPERFPLATGWARKAPWATPAQVRSAAEIERLASERRTLIDALESRETSTQQCADEANRAAAASSQRLLAADGDDLVAAVIDALDAAGFVVRNIDDERHRDDRREDLRVTDLDAPDW